ncbi:putative carbonic anhydrase 2 isoform X2 [Penaeus monodon]|nr:putative carbonic anhydrase 2 isoform X2 [Penaeus monodon]
MWKRISSSSSSSSSSSCCLVLLLASLLRQNAAQTHSSETASIRRFALPIQPQQGKACTKLENPGSWLSGDNCCRCKANEVTCRPKRPKCRDPPADTTGCRKKEVCGCTEWKCKSNKGKKGGRGQKARRNGGRPRKQNKGNGGPRRGPRRGEGGRRRGQGNGNQRPRRRNRNGKNLRPDNRNKPDRQQRKFETEGSDSNSTSPAEDNYSDYYYDDYYFDDYMYPDYFYGNMYGLECSCHTTWVQNSFYPDAWYDNFDQYYYSYGEDYPDDGFGLYYDYYSGNGHETEVNNGSSKEFDAFETYGDEENQKSGNGKGKDKERGNGKRKKDNREKRKRDRKRKRNEERNRKEKRKVVQNGNSIRKENGGEKGDGKRGQFKKKFNNDGE